MLPAANFVYELLLVRRIVKVSAAVTADDVALFIAAMVINKVEVYLAS
ncbi:hypothetical protein [Nonomuraea zeae]|nr:hypothetical protein [Nonomuraea zeae]